MNLHFRKMTTADAAAVELVEKACFGMPWSRESFWEEAANEKAYYLLALDDEKIIGYAGVWILADEAHITNVAVGPEYRGQKIGWQMMQEMMRIVKERGARSMTLEVRPSNAPAVSLYEGLGFKSVGLRPGYYQDNGEAAMIMWLTKL
jgi:ribosomal-protein-alanine acetyltransferase